MFRGVECPHEMSSRRVLETLETDRRTSGDNPVSSSKVCSVVSVELTGGDTWGVVSVCDMFGDWLGGIGRSLAAFIYAFVGVDRWWWGAQLCVAPPAPQLSSDTCVDMTCGHVHMSSVSMFWLVQVSGPPHWGGLVLCGVNTAGG